MRVLYEKNTANYPRLKTDQFFADYGNEYKFRGFIDKAIKYIEDFQLLRGDLWRRFVQQFREDADFDGGWRGEYWGKMMRGACFTYSYTKNPKLYEEIVKTVSDMMESADETGRISSYGVNHEFEGWDIWSRKYVLLGMQYFLEICKDDSFSAKVTASMCAQVDCIMEKIGDPQDGKNASPRLLAIGGVSTPHPCLNLSSGCTISQRRKNTSNLQNTLLTAEERRLQTYLIWHMRTNSAPINIR